ncbi:YfgM family protein [Neisseria weixii]|uniref:YfgM family protein n=1 Tax=Neisseria weixii TaxID=1853276 RepID=UPI000BB86CD5|nr:tetratricopeptide repeat protein [Neisseria weixii]ATD64814.1 hypothetical protein CGZ65_04925 [Neisseria weixii]
MEERINGSSFGRTTRVRQFQIFLEKHRPLVVCLADAGCIRLFGLHHVPKPFAEKSQEAAGALAKLVEKAQNKGDATAINADLKNLQQNFADTIPAAQATLMAAATEFDAGRYDVASGHLNWVLKNQKEPLVQALAAQRLAVVKLQQKKYDEALSALDTKVDADYEALLLETKGDVFAAQRKAKEAAASYEQALAKLPKDSVGRELVQMKLDSQK